MFSKLFSKKKAVIYNAASLFPLMKASELLRDQQYQDILKKIKKLLKVPEHIYSRYFNALINAYAEFVQAIPVYYAGELGGMLNAGLTRALFMLEIREEDASINKDDHLLTFVLFSASLLSDLFQLVIDRRVMISKKDGTFVKEWCPYLGSMLAHGSHYKIRQSKELPSTVQPHSTLALAMAVMPDKGYAWIAKYSNHLYLWMALLTDADQISAGPGLILSRVKELYERKEMEGTLQLLALTLELEPISKEDELTEAFYAWLVEALGDGNLAVNQADSMVHIVDEGVLLDTPLVFEEFFARNPDTIGRYDPQNIHWQTLANRFNQMGFTRLTGYEYKSELYHSQYPDIQTSATTDTNATARLENEAQQLAQVGIFQSADTAGMSGSIRQGMVVPQPDLLFVRSQLPSVTPYLQAVTPRPNPLLTPPPMQKPAPEKQPAGPMKISGPYEGASQ